MAGDADIQVVKERLSRRAWETNRAATSGVVGVQIVDRTIEIEVEVPVTVIRDLPALLDGVDALITALTRRPGVRRRT